MKHWPSDFDQRVWRNDLPCCFITQTRHTKSTGSPVDDDLMIGLIVQKTTGALHQHWRINIKNITTIQSHKSLEQTKPEQNGFRMALRA